MKSRKLTLGIRLWLVGMLGVLVLNFLASFGSAGLLPEGWSEGTLRAVGVAQGGIILLITVVLGVFFAPKVGLKTLFSDPFSRWKEKNIAWIKAVLSGLGLGVFLIVFDLLTQGVVPETAMAESPVVFDAAWKDILARLTYGGITEEVMVRFGLMSLFVWALSKVFKKENVYMWSGIFAAALLFGFGHLPVLFQLYGDPSTAFILRTIFLNLVGGLLFGYLYWKHYLETAMIAHAGAHAGMILTGFVLL